MKVLLSSIAVICLVGVLGCQNGLAKAANAVTPGELDKLLAPIALYPDALLAQMLLCTSDPPKIVELHAWLGKNSALKGTALQDAATVAGFEPSFVALVLFPQVVAFMAERPDWMAVLGKTFAADKTAVFDGIQRLRALAQASGALKDTPQQDVEIKKTSKGQDVIVIEPANPQIVYVPQYDPQVVYTQPTTTTVVVQDDNAHVDAAVAGLIGFTAGVAIGAAFDNNYYYGPYGWHGGAYMYNDAWDDYYDAREDAREDWIDHREDLVEERGERAGDVREERTERAREVGEQRTERSATAQQQRTERVEARQEAGTTGTTRTRSTTASTDPSRGYSGGERATSTRSGTSSDAFSGYSRGSSERAASSRGQRSRSSSGGGGRQRSGGGGRRR